MTDLVLLTGATGFVGRQVLRSLLAQNIPVRLVVRSGTEHQFDKCPELESVVTTDDLFAESENWWAKVCTGVHTVVHAAWFAKPGTYLWADENIDCLSGTLELAKGAICSKVSR